MIVRDHPVLSLSRRCRLLSARALLVLLRAEGGERRDTGTDAAGRRAVPEVSILRRPSDGASPAPRGRADRPTQGPSADAPDVGQGHGRRLAAPAGIHCLLEHYRAHAGDAGGPVAGEKKTV